jgi:hypothetical protein
MDNKSIINTASWKKKLNKILLYFSSKCLIIRHIKTNLRLFIIEDTLSVTLFLYICTKFLNKVNG